MPEACNKKRDRGSRLFDTAFPLSLQAQRRGERVGERGSRLRDARRTRRIHTHPALTPNPPLTLTLSPSRKCEGERGSVARPSAVALSAHSRSLAQ